MEAFINLLDRIWNKIYRRFLIWWELRRLYESAIRQARGDEVLKRTAMEILRSDFFDDFVRQRTITPEEEFAEFLKRLKENCPNADEVNIVVFLESVYGELATLMEGHEVWDRRGDEITEFLRWRRQPIEEVETTAPLAQYTNHFVTPPVAKNFLDRDEELEMLTQWLEDEAKTVGALIGIGGQGKTYLAAKFAEKCKQNGWQVRWMELPKSIDQFLRSIAAEMQIRGDPYHSAVGDSNNTLDVRIDNAVRFLEGSKDRWLFVLDDFHKVGDDSDWQKLITELDNRCQRTKVLLMARREPEFPLKLPTGTHELQDVSPLPKAFAQAYLEACGLKVSQDEAERIWEKCEGNCEAMKLFAQAARRKSVAKLLDLPLPDWSTDAPKWCEQLLSDLGEAEQEAGKRLALFDEPVEEDLLLHLGATQEGLERLLDWRLAEFLPDKRYTLHDIIKDYWRRKTSEDEKVKWHRLAGEWLEGQARKMREGRPKRVDEWELSEQKLWASFLRRAFWHFAEAGEVALALEVAKPITGFLYRWGEWEENLRICQKAYELAKGLKDEEKIAYYAHWLATTYHNQGRLEEAKSLYYESLEIQERLRDLEGQAATLHQLGMLAHDQGEYEEAEKLYRESLWIKERLESVKGKAETLHNLGILAYRQGKYEEAERLYCESLKIEERLGNLAGKAATLHNLGILAHKRGKYKEAERLYLESLKIVKQLGDLAGKAKILNQLGLLAYGRGEYEEAEKLYRESLEIEERLGSLGGKAEMLHNLGILAHRRDEYEEAEKLYRESLKIEEELKYLEGQAATLHQLGMLAHDQGEYEEAEKLYRESLEIEERLGNLAGKAATLHELGRLAHRRGNYEEAERLYRESLEIEERLGNLVGKAVTLHALGRLKMEQQRYEDAEQFIEEGLTIAKQLGSKPLQADGLWALGQLRKAQGRKKESRELLRQALEIFEQIGDARAEDVRKILQDL